MSKTNDRDIKIADFGFAKMVHAEECLKTQCGTPGYVAPEILRGVQYGQKADMWSLGVIAYILIGGYPPFIEQNQRELFRKIKRGSYEFHVEYWGQISREAKDLISALLTVDPKRRLSAQDALKDQWITGSDDYLVGQDLGVNLGAFKKFNAKRKLRQRASMRATTTSSLLAICSPLAVPGCSRVATAARRQRATRAHHVRRASTRSSTTSGRRPSSRLPSRCYVDRMSGTRLPRTSSSRSSRRPRIRSSARTARKASRHRRTLRSSAANAPRFKSWWRTTFRSFKSATRDGTGDEAPRRDTAAGAAFHLL